MKVILTKDVQSLGQTGDVVKVKPGHARNYLLPRNLAYLATDENLKRIEKVQASKKVQFEEEKNKAKELAEKMNKASLTVSAEVNDREKLYGAISETEILNALETEGFKIDKTALVIEKPIEELGIFEIGVKLHPEVTAKVRLWVTKK